MSASSVEVEVEAGKDMVARGGSLYALCMEILRLGAANGRENLYSGPTQNCLTVKYAGGEYHLNVTIGGVSAFIRCSAALPDGIVQVKVKRGRGPRKWVATYNDWVKKKLRAYLNREGVRAAQPQASRKSPTPAPTPLDPASLLGRLAAISDDHYPVTRGNAIRSTTLQRGSRLDFLLSVNWRDLLDVAVEVAYNLEHQNGDDEGRRKSTLEERMIGWGKGKFADYFGGPS